ncbi:MAG TPA: hypothetical protein VN203_27770 [Candidatus Acidoferrum sp.]|nr:hypothetical protein [Candidatus Acidoferrum sp.]
MKTLFIASMFTTLFAASTAFAFEWPSDPQPIKGTEGPDVRYSQTVMPQGGREWPAVR